MTASDRFGIRALEPGDRGACLELASLALGSGSVPRSEAFWRWKHEEGPFGPSTGWVAEASGRIVGLRIFLRWRFGTTSGPVAAVRAVDTMTHPEWRRRGVFSTLTRTALSELASDGVAFIFNTPNKFSGAGYESLGWQRCATPPMLVLPRRPLGMVMRALAKQAPEPARLDAWAPAEELLESPYLSSLLESRTDVAGQRTHRSLDFLRWRYAEIPGIEYRARTACADDGLAAIVARSRIRRSRREVLLAEILLSGPGGGRLAGSLIDELRLTTADYFLATAHRRSEEWSVLRRAGFRKVPWGPRLVARGLAAETPTDVLSRAEWHLSAGDLEVF